MGKNKGEELKGIGKLKSEVENIKEEMVDGYIETFKSKYDREPSETEIAKMRERAQKVVSRNIRRFGVKATAIFCAIGLTIGGAFWLRTKDDTKELPEGQKIEQTLEETTEKEKSKKEKYRDTIRVLSEEEQIRQDIKELDSVEEIEAYFNNLYTEAYEEVIGDENIDTSQIEITDSYPDYVFVLDKEQIVTHGNYPDETKRQIEADGKNYTTSSEKVKKIYTVTLDGKVIDAVTANDLKPIIHGNNYEDMKNGYESMLGGEIKEITEAIFDLEDLQKEVEQKPNDEYAKSVYEKAKSKLADAVIAYNKTKDTQKTQSNQQVQSNEDRGMEPIE